MKANIMIVLSKMFVLLFACLVGCLGGCGKNSSTDSTLPPAAQKIISFTPSGLPSNNSVYLQQVSTNNDEITLAVMIKGGLNVHTAAPEIDFAGSEIQFISGLEGNFLNQGGTATNFIAKLEDGSNGILLISISRLAGASGVNGDGVLCQIVLKVLPTQINTAITFNVAESKIISPTGNITGTIWLGGNLSYQ